MDFFGTHWLNICSGRIKWLCAVPPEFITFHIWVMITWLSVTSTPFPKKRGALSKNRTCDSSLPRTCFTTRLLGQFENHGQIIRTSRKKSSKNRHRPILSGYFVFFQFCFMFNRYTIRFHRLLNCPILCPCVHLIILKIR